MAPTSYKTIHQKSDFAVYFAVFRACNAQYILGPLKRFYKLANLVTT